MSIHELRERFETMKKYSPQDVNELLDFAKQNYLHNIVSLNEYRLIVRELEKEGAKNPDYHCDLNEER